MKLAVTRAAKKAASETLGVRQSVLAPTVDRGLNSSAHPIEDDTLAFMGRRFGYDFSRVRVHCDARAAESAKSIGARAYTAGEDIVFGAKEYEPESFAGRLLLAHELTHVIQQRAPGHITAGRTGPFSDDAEAEADRTASAVVASGPSSCELPATDGGRQPRALGASHVAPIIGVQRKRIRLGDLESRPGAATRDQIEEARRYALLHEKPDDLYKLEFLTRGEPMPNDPYPQGGPASPDDVHWHDLVVAKYGPDCTDNMGRLLDGLPIVENERVWHMYHDTRRRRGEE